MRLSRILLPVLPIAAMLAAPGYAEISSGDLVAQSEEAIAQANERLGISDDECQSNGRQIVVCAQQNRNDRYRLPFETVVAGDPDNEGVWGERERIQANPGTCQSAAFFQAFCGAVGVSVGLGGANSGFRTGGLRRVGQ